ncbi:MAG: hypothetical protein HC788_12130 [Sphingopyxis sp.]|nr:hypothetical protein [Sphingopyxis sp.]
MGAAQAKLRTAQAAARQDKAVIAQLRTTIESQLGTLAAEKTAFTDELARRDAQYASDLAALQLAGEQLLATPEGLRALELYNAGGPGAFEAADRVLGEIEGYRDPGARAPAQLRDELALELSDLQVMLFKLAYLCDIDMEEAMTRGQQKADQRFPDPTTGPADQQAYWQRFRAYLAQKRFGIR